VRFPYELRESLVISIDDFFETENDDPDATTLASVFITAIQNSGEEVDLEEEDLVSLIEDNAELDEPLQHILEEEFSKNDELELTGDDVVAFVEKLLHIEWTDSGLEGEMEYEEDDYVYEDDE